ncbi:MULTISPECIES: secretin N-terminal domain-containing protein [Pseudanabaena]|uniref:Type II and III secretion system protein n=2 Tax=Pseudanabaena TaxID=1152 RepID=L8N5R6_9CYAN|nr:MULTISPECIES: secretin N-terminal domain-containing protein [Pseudanabaena]ELS33563.1 type II and III secretion system protein [Pseudanabaena biceps PCC 7429]MDG3494212.1 AMIN domain-containing protein [Pseudanabaena catenata USMAC16]
MNAKLNAKLNVKLNMKLNDRLNVKLNRKSLACWFLIAASCPQVLLIAPSQSQTTPQSSISANSTDVTAVASRITDINTNVSGDRLDLTVNFASSDRPKVTYTKQGKSWVALLNGAQLQLGNGNASYAKTNPAPGIAAIEATQYAANKVQIRVTANDPETLKELIKRQDNGDSLVFSLEMQPSVNQVSSISEANSPESGVVNSQTTTDSTKVLTAQNSSANSASLGKPLFEPKITVTDADGKTRVAQSNAPNSAPPPIANPVTPQLQGRVPGVVPPFRQLKTPPVGDIATSSAKLRPDIVDLGTAERVPRITLREAPAIEVLNLIGRVAGLSVVSAEAAASTTGATATTASSGGGLKQPVSLSIENETAQDVFNNVLRITGLDANRIGNTIFVATKLPVTLKNLVTKNYRLNQITVGEASAYLIGLGASRIVNRQRPIPGAQTATVGTASAATVVNIPTESIPTLETITVPADSSTSSLLKGLQVIAEERGNSLTLIGSPKQIEFAEAQLARLDLRKRQVAVNVKVVEVNLDKNQTIGSSLSFNASNTDGSGTGTAISSAVGVLGLNFNDTTGTPSILTSPQRLFGSLSARIVSGNAKVITDPTLTVQEGETATVALTEDVVTANTVTITTITSGTTTQNFPSQTVTTTPVGLTLNLNVLRVDDNGFINFAVSPSVSALVSTQQLGTVLGIQTSQGLISKRTLNSGQIRVRDGQTLVLSGIIRDSDRQTFTKVPFLGDLPIIGALFRQESNQNVRNEVIIIVTPRIIDDSQNANWGYTYQPGPEVQKVIDSNLRKSQ